VRNESGLGMRTNKFAYRPSVSSLNPALGVAIRTAPGRDDGDAARRNVS